MPNLNIELLECSGCGAPLDVANIRDGLCKCKYCAYVNVMPKDDQRDEVLLLLHDGETELRNSSFERAYNAFKRASELSPDESRAYFGMALAANRVKYIRDVVNNRCQPICFEITGKRFDSDKNYSIALDRADTDAQYNEYVSKAREIDYIREQFASLKASYPKYDTFLCVKVTERDGSFTQDSQWATRLYDAIKRAGYTPFYSERDVGDRLGEDYEAIILYALYCAKSMIIVCSNEDYLRTPWVQNEYSRYYAMLNENEKKANSITIAFNDNVIERIPGIRGKIEGVNLKSFDASQKICEFVAKFAKPEVKEVKRVKLCVNCGAECDLGIKFCSECGSSTFANDRSELIKLREEAENRKREEENRLREQAELRAKRELEEKVKEAEERARREAEEKARREAEDRARREADEKSRREAEERARLEAEDRARREADEKSRREAEEKARREREELEAKLRQAENTAAILRNSTNSASPTVTVSGGNLKYCIKCGAENPSSSAFCSSCGGKEFSETNRKYCTSCGAENAFTAKFCSKCGRDRFVNSDEELALAREEQRKREEADAIRRIAEERQKAATDAALEREKQVEVNAEAIRRRIAGAKDQAMWRYGCNVENGRLVSCSISDKYFELPNYGDKSFSVIGKGAFASSKAVAVVVPNGVTKLESFAFSGATSLEYVFLPNSVNYIGDNAFKGCTSLKYVNIPTSVKTVSASLFSGCSSLQSIRIHPGALVVAANAFEGCTSLELLTVPYKLKESFTAVLDAAQKRVLDMYDKDVKKSSVANEDSAREEAERKAREESERKAREESERKAREEAECKAREESERKAREESERKAREESERKAREESERKAREESERKAREESERKAREESERKAREDEARRNKAKLDDVFKVRDGMLLKYIGNDTEVTVPNHVTRIESAAFDACKNLKKVIIHDKVKDIGCGAFRNCTALEEITLPFVGGVLDSETKLHHIFDGDEGISEVKSEYSMGSIITSETYRYLTSLKKVTVTGGIIRKEAFAGYENLETVILTGTVSRIDGDAFKLCKKLRNLQIGDSVKSIFKSAFNECPSLTELKLPKFINNAHELSFETCTALASVTVDASAQNYKSVDGCLFSKDGKTLVKYPPAKKVKAYNVPSDVTTIAEGAFAFMSVTERIITAPGLLKIEAGAFRMARSLKSIELSASVNSIGTRQFGYASGSYVAFTNVFAGCENLESIAVAKGNTVFYSANGDLYSKAVMGLIAYAPANKGAEFVLPKDAVAVLDYAFSECKSIKKVVLHENVRSIRAEAFSGCKALESVVLPDGLESIGSNAFRSCGIKDIFIPKSVSEMGQNVFGGCKIFIRCEAKKPLLRKAPKGWAENWTSLFESSAITVMWGAKK